MYAEIMARLAALEAASGGTGRFELGEPTSEEELRAFEAAHGVQLPEVYRGFLLAVGQAAPGPEYGFLTLEAAISERGASIYGLADPFPAPTSSLELVAFDVGGVLPLTYDGCEFFKGLVVSGPARGTVWFNVPDRPGWVPEVIAAVNGRGKPLKVSRGDYRAYYDQLLAPVNRDRASSFEAFFDSWLASEEKTHGLGSWCRTAADRPRLAMEPRQRDDPARPADLVSLVEIDARRRPPSVAPWSGHSAGPAGVVPLPLLDRGPTRTGSQLDTSHLGGKKKAKKKSTAR